ncbi:MAG: PolC-type DNA polymerase III [Bacilli bacterium]|nr:PolC-type DNA polymerase III [Bacilli bacterium]
MSMQNEKWLDILALAGIEANEFLKDGEINGVKLLDEGTIWQIYLKFPNIIGPNETFKMMDKLSKYFISLAPSVTRVQFFYEYENEIFQPEELGAYFEKAIAELGRSNKRVRVFEYYSKEFLENRINIYVASQDDKEVALDALKYVKGFFNCFGLSKVTFEVSVSGFEIDVKEDRMRQIELKNEYADTRILEQKKREIATRDTKTDTKTFKNQKSNVAIHREISELPISSMEVMEFKQINSTDHVEVEGVLISGGVKKAGKYELFEGIVSNGRDSIVIKQFINNRNEKFYKKEMTPGHDVTVKGSIQYDNFIHDVVIMVTEITLKGEATKKTRLDDAPIKRIELHAHTKMSTLDSVLDVEDYVKTAKKFGHDALAVTDHANCHVLPEFFSLCQKHQIKAIAGVEGYYIDDDRYKIALTDEDIDLSDATFVVFDVETTGFSVTFNEIIEIGALKVKNGIILDSFSTFVQPSRPISKVITDLTEITNDDVANAPTIEEVMPKFVEFINDAILVAHNATFDTGHIYYQMKRLGLYKKDLPCIDTLQLAKAMYSDILKRFKLSEVAKGLKVNVEQQHRALSDSQTTTNVFMKMLGDLQERCIYNYKDINSVTNVNDAFKFIIPTHINILVKNKAGLKNFYKIISDSHTTHFHKEPRVLKSVLEKNREGLLIGSGCSSGEIFKAAFEKSYEELVEKMKFYDYIEVQPLESYFHLAQRSGEEITKIHIKEAILRIIEAAKSLNKIVIATGDVHMLNREDGQYREIYMSTARPGGGIHELSDISMAPPLYFRTTNEMLEAFNFLPIEVAYDIVINNPRKINDMIEAYDLFPPGLLAPRDDFMSKYGVPSMAKAVEEISYQTAHEKYGSPLPKYIEERLEKELKSIIGNKFASVYYISHTLVKNSNENGYIVGSRGSVGSSFVATMMKITEVNPLKPHYVCPHCKFVLIKDVDADNNNYPELINNLQNVNTGQDLPKATCPVCGSHLIGDGVDIPFETFLGFKGDKTPDIDLNFSGEYQDKAHLFCRDVFGIDNSFRAGTIGTVAEKTAFGFVRGYLERKGKNFREAEIKRVASGIVGAKRTTGQHPGGIIVIPDTIEYTDIIPVQYPADDVNSAWRTSHYEYHSFEKNLLKLDILGHDDPTVIKHLMDFVKMYPDEFPFSTVEGIPYTDQEVISLFCSKDALHLIGNDGDDFKSGTIGVPEFGTRFVREMLNDIMPKSFDEIVKVSGLSHGTDVWLGNAKDLVLGNNMTGQPIPFSKVIGCRDDIMVDLLAAHLDPADAFRIMEMVRKGKGVPEKDVNLLREYNVPEWYIDSCQKIKYMFPKAHATAYVIMALRIAWFKVHRPIYYYAAYFSHRASAFDVEVLSAGRNAIRNKINEIRAKIDAKTASNKEIDLLDELQIALEMYLRGFTLKQVDINKSAAHHFVLSEDKKGLYMPFSAVDALGDAAAQSIVDARNAAPFSSKKDVEKRTKITKTIFNRLKAIGALDDLPDEDVNYLL